jgi:hypothetical protein
LHLVFFEYAGRLKSIRVVFSAQPFTAINPPHRTDIGKTLTRLPAPFFLPPIFTGGVLLKINLGILGTIGFFIFDHGSPFDGQLIHPMMAQHLKLKEKATSTINLSRHK